MNKFNLLIIDDELKATNITSQLLKKADKENIINKIDFYDTNKINETNIKQLHKEDFASYAAILIDYDLNKSFHGDLIAAYLLLIGIKVPLIAFTGAQYPEENHNYALALLKDEVNDDPLKLINKIKYCIANYNYNEKLKAEYSRLAMIYSELIENSLTDNSITENQINKIEKILDEFEKILDPEQEALIKERIASFTSRTKEEEQLFSKIQQNECRIKELLEKRNEKTYI